MRTIAKNLPLVLAAALFVQIAHAQTAPKHSLRLFSEMIAPASARGSGSLPASPEIRNGNWGDL